MPTVHRPFLGRLPRLLGALALAVPAGLAGASANPAHPVQAAAIHPVTPQHVSPAAIRAAGSLIAGLPMRFEPNAGQESGAVRYFAGGPRYGVYVSATNATITLSRTMSSGHNLTSRPAPLTSAVVGMTLVGGNAHATVQASGRLSGTTNYFIGNKPQGWHTAVPGYGRVLARGVYPGIDVAYYGNGRQLEYDFLLASHANPSTIRLAFSGVSGISLDRSGNLLLKLPGATLTEHAPRLYQQGSHGRVAIAGRFVLLGHNQVGFAIGRYDQGRALVIDPSVVLYATYLGGTAFDGGFSVTYDSQGNIYLDGYIDGPGTGNFPSPTPSGFRAFTGEEDIFVAKIHPAGAGSADLVYFDYVGGSGLDYVFDNLGNSSIALDSAGDAYVAGASASTDFPTTPGAYQTTNHGNFDAVVFKVNPTGTALLLSTYVGGGCGDLADALALDASGDVYVTGQTSTRNFSTGFALPAQTGPRSSTRARGDQALVSSQAISPDLIPCPNSNAFPTTNGTTIPTNKNATDFPDDFFVIELNPTFSTLLFSTLLGGNGEDDASSIALTKSGLIMVAGYSSSTNFPGVALGYQSTNPDSDTDGDDYAGVVALVNPATSTIANPDVVATYLRGSSSVNDDDNGTFITGMAIDGMGNVDVAGYTYDPTFPTTPGAFETTFDPTIAGEFDDVGFVSQLNANLSLLTYSTFYQPTADQHNNIFGDFLAINALAVDQANDIYITGFSNDPVPETSGSILNPAVVSANDGFVGGNFIAELIPNLAIPPAGQLLYSTLVSGGSEDFDGAFFEDIGFGIAVDPNGVIYNTGAYLGTDGDLPVTTGAYQTTDTSRSGCDYSESVGSACTAFALKLNPQREPNPICTVLVALYQGNTRLGVTAAERTILQPPFPAGYITYTSAGSVFTARMPLDVTCQNAGLATASATVTGTVSTGHGIFHPGDAVQVTITENPLYTTPASATVIVVQDLTTGYSATLTAPYGFGSSVRVLPN